VVGSLNNFSVVLFKFTTDLASKRIRLIFGEIYYLFFICLLLANLDRVGNLTSAFSTLHFNVAVYLFVVVILAVMWFGSCYDK